MDYKSFNKSDFRKTNTILTESEKNIIRESGQDFINYFFEIFKIIKNKDNETNAKINKVEEIYNKILNFALGGKINFDFDKYKEYVFGEYHTNYDEIKASIATGNLGGQKKILNQIYDDFIQIDNSI